MIALLLAAGLGTRLRPLTYNTPKCLVEINNKPLLKYWLEMLFSQNIEHVYINTHHFSDQVKQFVVESEFKSRITILHETNLLQTGGTLVSAEEFFVGETVLVAHADNLCWFSVNDFYKSHEKAGRPLSIFSFNTENPKSCGILEVDQNNLLTDFFEKVSDPPGNLANGAIYLFDREVIDFAVGLEIDKFEITEKIIPAFLNNANVYINDCYLRDIGTLQSLEQAKVDIQQDKRLASFNYL